MEDSTRSSAADAGTSLGAEQEVQILTPPWVRVLRWVNIVLWVAVVSFAFSQGGGDVFLYSATTIVVAVLVVMFWCNGRAYVRASSGGLELQPQWGRSVLIPWHQLQEVQVRDIGPNRLGRFVVAATARELRSYDYTVTVAITTRATAESEAHRLVAYLVEHNVKCSFTPYVSRWF